MKRTDKEWEGLVQAANAINDILKRKPRRLKVCFQCSPGGILNAFREGDITFKQAVLELKRWSKRTQKQTT